MKLTEDQIIDLLQSPEPLVRQAACDYFAQAFRDHPRLFEEIRTAAEKYGGDELFVYWDWFSHLIVPDQHWPWVVKHAEVEDSAFGDACRFLLLAQDTAALKKHEALWQGNENLGLGEDTEAWLKQRLELLEGTAEDAWKQLEAWAQDRLKLPLDERWDETWAADAMTEAVRRGTSDELRERVRAIVLAGENDPEQVDYYLIPWAIRLSGEWRLEDTADAIFLYDRSATHPAIYQEASDALAKIGGESALRALTAGWADWDQGERTLAALHLVNQRGPAAIEAALQVAAEMASQPEEAGDILQLLGDCILVHFDQEAGERLIAALPTDEATEPCAKGLIIWALGLGLEHPDRERWPRLVEARLEKVGQHEHHECGPGCDHDHDHGDGHSHDHAHSHSHEHHHCGPGCDHDHGPAHAEEDESEIDHDPQTVRKDQGRVGRNDPCPCGSGKKYKKCCLNVAATTDLVDFDF